MSDPLRHLLQQADASLAEPARAISAETLLAASRRQRGQTQRQRFAVAGGAAALASVAVAFVVASLQITPSKTPRETRVVVESGVPAPIDVPAPRRPDELRAEIAALEREAAWRTKLAKSIELANLANMANMANSAESQIPEWTKSRELVLSNPSDLSNHSQNPEDFESASAPTLNNADWLRVESARTAALSWHYAHMAEHEFHDLATARREYERLIQRFPGTTWADRSQVSLDRILTSHKTPL